MSQSNQLFGKKTLEKFCSDIKVTAKQKKAAKEWLTLLKENKLRDEKKNYLKFSRIILEDILGYPVKNIDHESGNVEFQFADSSGKNIICIEAKGTDTKDLFALQHRAKKEHATPIKQTWDYMGKLDLEYGICTNYKHFVLITKSRGYSKYFSFDFTKAKDEDSLKEFIGIFSKSRIIDEGFVEKLYDESVMEEKEFTKEFYKLYHETRLILVRAFSEKQDVSKEDAIHYSQLFLNRLIFVFFVSDSGDIPNRLFTQQMHKVLNSDLVDEDSRLAFDQIVNLFRKMNKGSHEPKIFGFNGGLFADEIPHEVYFKDIHNPKLFSDIQKHSRLKKSVKLDEYSEKIIKKYGSKLNPLISNLLIMDSFDFTTEVNVNILGHIFEQSISDLEELSGNETSKRKKEGVYYTPEYITDYICRNTIIPYLSKSGKVTDTQELVSEYGDDIELLEKKFNEIKILDPACGSGAFLVKAVDILLEINKVIQDYKQLQGKYSTGDQFSMDKWNEESEVRAIIENNIYGVDINEESIGITRLAMFLKIASANRKLMSLSNNIKVGNSLIDDNTVDPKAFDWEEEFPEILSPLIENRGFDIVIGNPPYFQLQKNKKVSSELSHFPFKTYSKSSDIYCIFYEQGVNLLKTKGMLGYVTSNSWLKTKYGLLLRRYLKEYTNPSMLIVFENSQVFDTAIVESNILILEKNNFQNNLKALSFNQFAINENFENHFTNNCILLNNLDDNGWIISDINSSLLREKLENNSTSIKELNVQIYIGLLNGFNDAFIIDTKVKNEIIKKTPKSKEIIQPILRGRDIGKYCLNWKDLWLINSHNGIKGKITRIDVPKYFPSVYTHLLQYQEQLEIRYNQGLHWTNLRNCAYLDELKKPKIIWGELSDLPKFTFDDEGFIPEATLFAMVGDNLKYLLGILNSKLALWYFEQISTSSGMGTSRWKKYKIEQLPIKNTSNEKIEKVTRSVDHILFLNKSFTDIKKKFFNRIIQNFNLEKLSSKLENFEELDFNQFHNQLKKQKIVLSLEQQDEWQDYFERHKTDLINLKSEINKTDLEINQIVYKLYGLTDDEIKLVEESL